MAVTSSNQFSAISHQSADGCRLSAESYQEPVFVNGVVIGFLKDDVFTQHITQRHIFRKYNAKGMDLALYRALAARYCDTWRLQFKDTGQVLSIPFDDIARVGHDTDTGAGIQIMVKLSDFAEQRAPIQEHLL